MDPAFSSKKSNAMLKSHQNTNVNANGNTQQSLGINRQATSVRQLSKW